MTGRLSLSMVIVSLLCRSISAVHADDCAGYDPTNNFVYSLFLPCSSGAYDWCYGGNFNYPVVQVTPGSVVLSSSFEDNDDQKGYQYTIANINGEVVKDPISGNYTQYGRASHANCWYEKGWGSDNIVMPGNRPSDHTFEVSASMTPRSYFKPRWKQTQWPLEKYGRPGSKWESTISRLGCCMTCLTMILYDLGYRDLTPPAVNQELRSHFDGYSGKKGLSVNWSRVQIEWGVIVKWGIPIKTALLQGLDLMRGVKHRLNSKGKWETGHWVHVRMFKDGDKGPKVIDDPMDRGCVDTEILGYLSGENTWQTDTRTIWLRPNSLIGHLLGSDSTPMTTGAILAAAKTATTDKTVATIAGSSSTLPDQDNLVNWGYSAFAAWPTDGDVQLVLKDGDRVVAEEEALGLENNETGEVVEDSSLEALNLGSGNYTLEVTGAAGASFTLDTFEYSSLRDVEPTKRTVTGVIPANGVFQYQLAHKAIAYIRDLAGLVYVPEGNQFILYEAGAVTVRVENKWVVQSNYPLVFPRLMSYTGTATITPYTTYQMQGVVGPNRTLIVDFVQKPASSYEGWVDCQPVFRNLKDVFSPIAGYLYTKVCGRITEVGATSLKLDNKLTVKMTVPETVETGMTISVCGVPVNGEFIGCPTSLVDQTDWEME